MGEEKNVNEIFANLINEFRKLEKSKRLSTKEDELLETAVQWLKDHQHPDGYWGYESVADTGMVLLTFSIYNIKKRKWLIKGKHSGGLNKCIDWLKSIRNVDNWENNLWDSSICLQALYRLGIREDWIFKITEWVKNKCKKNPNKFEVHHLAQAANALFEASLEEDAQKVGETIASRIKERLKYRKEEEYLFDIYVTGQALDALTRLGYTWTSEIVRACEADLRRFLEEMEEKGISEATFQDVMMGFMGLASFSGGEDDKLINTVITDIFKMPVIT